MQTIWLLGLHIVFYAGVSLVLAVPISIWAFGLAGLLIWISMSDCLSFEIPDIASLALSTLTAFWLYTASPDHSVMADHLLGAVFWPMVFLLAAVLFKRRHDFEGLGFGDVKLMIGLGLLCGFQGSVYVVLIASVTAALVLVVSLSLQTTNQRSSDTTMKSTGIAFGPFLCAAAWGIWLLLFGI